MPGAAEVEPLRRTGPSTPQVIADVVLAGLFTGSAAVLLQVLSPRADGTDWVFVAALGAPLVLRRSRPRTSAALVGAGALGQVVAGSPIGFHDAAVLLAVATLSGWASRRTGLVGLGVALLLVVVGSATDWWGYLDRRLGPDPAVAHLLSTVGAAVLVGAAWAYGRQARAAREGAEALLERAARRERERQQQAELAVAAERARIAREMHDVVAHGLTLMVVRADSAQYTQPPPTEAARVALADISRAGRAALAEMRNLLGLLRAETGEEVPAPMPGLWRLDDLVAEARAAGEDVILTCRGDLAAVSEVASLTAYRVVQEGLTNARRYGGGAVQVEVTVDHGDLALRVQDEGGTAGEAAPQVPGSGHGLVGIRERVAACGGRTEAGPVEGGGFVVRAWLPAGEPADGGRRR